jgi:hypothetical protein
MATCEAYSEKVEVILRPTVSRPVHLRVRLPSGIRDQFFPFSLYLFLDSCGFVDVWLPLFSENVMNIQFVHNPLKQSVYKESHMFSNKKMRFGH